MILFSVYLLIGISLEGFAFYVLVSEKLPEIITIVMHLAASAAIIYALYHRHKKYINTLSITAMLFMMVFFIPILGIIGSIVIARWLVKGQKKHKPQKIKLVNVSDMLKPMRSQQGLVGLKFRLESHNFKLSDRINALKILSALPAGKKNQIIRGILSDEHDELRLLAFNLIDQQEKQVIKNINNLLQLEKKVSDERGKAIIYKHLAFEYWELVYCSLIEPIMMQFFLNQAKHYVTLASEVLQSDATLRYLLGRIYMRLNKIDLAVDTFQQAVQLGESVNLILPFLAEGLFYQKKYSELRQLLSSNYSLITSMLNKSIIEFWSMKYE